MFPLLKKVCRRQHQKGSSSQKPRSTRLFLEALEDRTVPTVVFNSAFGGDTIVWGPNWWGEPVGQTVTGPLNNNPGALQDPKVYLIFWGPSWTQANAGKFASDAQAIINSAYLSGLTDYGSDGIATYGGYTIDNSPSTLGPVAATQETQYILNYKMTSWDKPTQPAFLGGAAALSSPIYFVVSDLSFSAGNGTDDYTPLNSEIPLLINHVWIDTGTNEDSFTDLFSHELAERISDGGGGIKMNASVNISGEYQNSQIADNEPDGGRYTYRLNGSVLVQAYWSLTYQAFVVPDGTQQTVYLSPHWNNTKFSGNFSLKSSGKGSNQSVTLDTLNDGKGNLSLAITLNGENYQFDPGKITSAVFNLGSGSNTAYLNSLPSGVKTSINSGGPLTVNYDTDSAVQGTVSVSTPSWTLPTIADNSLLLAGKVMTVTATSATVDNNASLTYSGQNLDVAGTDSLIIDDSANTGSQAFNIYDGVVDYGAAAISYQNNFLVTIKGGSGGNQFTVNNNSNPLELDTGSGTFNTVEIAATSAPVSIVGQASQSDRVTIGSNHDLNNVTGQVTIVQGAIQLTIDDQDDPNGPYNIDISNNGFMFSHLVNTFITLHISNYVIAIPVLLEEQMAAININPEVSLSNVTIYSPEGGGNSYYGDAGYPPFWSDVYVFSSAPPWNPDTTSGPNASRIVILRESPIPKGHLQQVSQAISFYQTLALEEFELTMYTVLDLILGAMGQPHAELDAALGRLHAAAAHNPSSSTLEGQLAMLTGESTALNALSDS